jgi:chemotaxis signal transduction protein/nucleoid-associated protein YgaU
MRELLLASLGGRQYGIWKDEILSVRDIHALHRIPLSPARIAGIMVEEGQTVTLADLSACIGFEPSAAIIQGCIILMAEGDKLTGFVVSGELRTQSILPNSLFPLPDYLKTPVFDTCAVHDGITIPVINIAELYSRVLKSVDEPSEIMPRVAAVHPENSPVAGPIRYFSAAGEIYAVSASGIDDKAVKPEPITPLPHTPRYVKGVTFRDGRLLPVIDLTQRIKQLNGAPESLMLIARVADDTFGFLIDSDEGSSSAGKVSIKQLPLIAQTPWLKKVVVRAGELVPLVDLAMALSPVSGGADDKPIWQRYAPASGFPALFANHEVEVVEFLLLGVRHALPKVEMEEAIAFKPSRTLPDVLPIVIGVAEHNGEILPVVDLAMMFGRRSLTTPAWRMMVVSNGDFRALVLTEAVFGERRLPLEIQHSVPIHLPHNLMYGCYPDEQSVRIILNVEAISVYFEKALIQKFMPALSHEMRMSPTGVLYTFPEEKAERERAERERAEWEKAEREKAEREKAEREKAEREESTERISLPEETVTPAQTAAPAHADAIPVPETEGDTLSMDVTPATASAERKPEKTIEPGTGAAAESAPENMPKEIAEPAVPLRDTPPPASSGEAGTERESEIASRQSALEALRASAKNKQATKISETANVDSRQADSMRTAASVKSGEPYQLNRKADQLAVLSGHQARAAETWKRRIGYGATVAVLMAVFYFTLTSEKPAVEKTAPGAEPVKTEQAPVQPTQSVQSGQSVQANEKDETETARVAQAKPEAKARTKTKTGAKQILVLSPLVDEKTGAKHSADKSGAPLELDIPADMPAETEVYVAQQGDTLWSISERFTGNPYNYPRIAGENRIANPDLIFPGQRIRLIK